MGKVILIMDVLGCREIVVDGVNGFLVLFFFVEKLVEKMFELINKFIFVCIMGIESCRIVEEKFDVRKVNKRIIFILEE